jgi:hypothetical protein
MVVNIRRTSSERPMALGLAAFQQLKSIYLP